MQGRGERAHRVPASHSLAQVQMASLRTTMLKERDAEIEAHRAEVVQGQIARERHLRKVSVGSVAGHGLGAGAVCALGCIHRVRNPGI